MSFKIIIYWLIFCFIIFKSVAVDSSQPTKSLAILEAIEAKAKEQLDAKEKNDATKKQSIKQEIITLKAELANSVKAQACEPNTYFNKNKDPRILVFGAGHAHEHYVRLKEWEHYYLIDINKKYVPDIVADINVENLISDELKGEFDYVILEFVPENAIKQGGWINNAYDALKPGGKLISNFFNSQVVLSALKEKFGNAEIINSGTQDVYNEIKEIWVSDEQQEFIYAIKPKQ